MKFKIVVFKIMHGVEKEDRDNVIYLPYHTQRHSSVAVQVSKQGLKTLGSSTHSTMEAFWMTLGWSLSFSLNNLTRLLLGG